MAQPFSIAQFVASARALCAWIEGPAGSTELENAIRLISRLHADAVMLPNVDGSSFPDDEMPNLSITEKNAVRERFRTFPFQYYWGIFNPITPLPEGAVCGDICDDFLDIYTEVKTGLMVFDQGRQSQAVWHWRFSWHHHWAKHATDALKALQSFYTDSGQQG